MALIINVVDGMGDVLLLWCSLVWGWEKNVFVLIDEEERGANWIVVVPLMTL